MTNIENIQGKYTAKSLFVESAEKNKPVIIRGLMLPKNKISRNGVLYEWESVRTHSASLVGKPVMYNHFIDTDMEPLGHYTDSICLEGCPKEDSKWFTAWKKTEQVNNKEVPGWYYEANLNPDNKYTKSVLRGDLNKVSIQLFADKAYEEEAADGDNYTLAYVGSILEGSIVPCPGFEQTSIEVAMSEAFKKEYGSKKPLYFVENKLTKKIIPVFKEAEEFPMEVFQKGIETELSEHPNISSMEIAQLVLDHLKEDSKYYLNSEETMSTDNIPTKTKIAGKPKKDGSGPLSGTDACPKTEIIDKQKNIQEDKMTEEAKIEDPKPTPIKPKEEVKDEVKKENLVKKKVTTEEEYAGEDKPEEKPAEEPEMEQVDEEEITESEGEVEGDMPEEPIKEEQEVDKVAMILEKILERLEKLESATFSNEESEEPEAKPEDEVVTEEVDEVASEEEDDEEEKAPEPLPESIQEKVSLDIINDITNKKLKESVKEVFK